VTKQTLFRRADPVRGRRPHAPAPICTAAGTLCHSRRPVAASLHRDRSDDPLGRGHS